jgi:hypothetical protein
VWLGIPGIAAALSCCSSTRTAAPLVRLPLAALVGFQAFRLPLELVMHEAARAGVMPSLLSRLRARAGERVGPHLPFVFLPGVMVPAALFGHVLVIRRLRSATNEAEARAQAAPSTSR